MPATSESETGSSGRSDAVVNIDDPLCLHANDIVFVTIISFKLVGTSNYKNWATATVRALSIRNKLGLLTVVALVLQGMRQRLINGIVQIIWLFLGC